MCCVLVFTGGFLGRAKIWGIHFSRCYLLLFRRSYFYTLCNFGRCESLGGAKVWEVLKFGRYESLGGAKVWEVLKFGRC